jgi:N-acyl-D-amino-acid deacylase
MLQVMNTYHVPGAALAVSRNGRLIFAHGYGYANTATQEPVQPDGLFRIASITKPITATAVFKLIQDGKLQLDTTPFTTILSDFTPPPGQTEDPRINEITVQDLLYHAGGWDRSVACPPYSMNGCDPPFVFADIAAEAVGAPAPATPDQLIRFMLGRPLQHDPGTTYAYSNFGYIVLGKIIERVSGQSYEDYIRDNILDPLQIERMQLGGSLLSDRQPAEVEYYDFPGASLVTSVFPPYSSVPAPYGGFSVELNTANGGWIASTMDLLRYLDAMNEQFPPPYILQSTPLTELGYLPLPPIGNGYNWFFAGSFPGNNSLLHLDTTTQVNGQLSWSALFNTRYSSIPNEQPRMAADSAIEQALENITSWPAGDLFPMYTGVTNVPGSLSRISVGADGSVWGVNSSQELYSYDLAAHEWQQLSGALVQIAASSATSAWGLNAQQQIYQWNANTKNWDNVPGSLTQIAVGADGDVWGINYQSNIYHYDPGTGFFAQVPGTLSQIRVGSAGAVYGINSAGSVFWYNPGTGFFEYLPGVALSQIAVGADGDVWGVSNKVPYHYDALSNAWTVAGAVNVSQVEAGTGGNVWAVDQAGNTYHWHAPTQNWTQVAGSITQIAVGGDGSVWALNGSQQIFNIRGPAQRYRTPLYQVPGSLSQISVGTDGSAFGLNSANQIFFFDVTTQNWRNVPGLLKQIAVGDKSTVWGVNESDEIFRYDAPSQTWTSIPGALEQIAVGANQAVWGINAAGQTYAYNSANQSWTEIPGSLKQLSVGADGTVWGVNAQQQIYRYAMASNSWVNVPGALVQIAVGNANQIWGVNAQQEVYHYMANRGWAMVPGASLVQIAAAFDGSVWGVNAEGQLYEWNGTAQSFTLIGSGMSLVAIGSGNAVFSLSSAGSVYRYW